MKNLFLIVFCFISVNFYGQDLEQDWIVDTILNSETNNSQPEMTPPLLSLLHAHNLNVFDAALFHCTILIKKASVE